MPENAPEFTGEAAGFLSRMNIAQDAEELRQRLASVQHQLERTDQKAQVYLLYVGAGIIYTGERILAPGLPDLAMVLLVPALGMFTIMALWLLAIISPRLPRKEEKRLGFFADTDKATVLASLDTDPSVKRDDLAAELALLAGVAASRYARLRRVGRAVAVSVLLVVASGAASLLGW